MTKRNFFFDAFRKSLGQLEIKGLSQMFTDHGTPALVWEAPISGLSYSP